MSEAADGYLIKGVALADQLNSIRLLLTVQGIVLEKILVEIKGMRKEAAAANIEVL